MLTRKQLKILNLFSENLFREYTFKEIKKSLKEKSNSIIQNAIKQFLKDDLITERKIGTSKLYRINHQNDKVYTYLNIIAKESLPELVKKSIGIIKNELNKKTYFYSLVIFGSYANNKQKEKSDFDIAVFIEEGKQKKIMKAALSSAEDKTLLKLDSHVISKDEFLEMLKAEYANLGKEIAKNHLAIHNPNIFYSILKEGIKNGFRL
ncbi:MAG: nucleotidyltransferase domain-containing protein [Nanoarchaeota archaeon]|nr:nucleotidyltransferase domain-containing protein [Nanoarchaeota archaeon]MCG2717683.1 nucleotidyltransferase domain-containing protein [Nanoarchaeota archaeon]